MSDSICPNCARIAAAALFPEFSHSKEVPSWRNIEDHQIQFCGVRCARAAFMVARKIAQDRFNTLVDMTRTTIQPIIIERTK